MARQFAKISVILALVFSGCSAAPPPPEVELALAQELGLWRAGAAVYAPEKFAQYKAELRKGMEDFARQKARLAPFRDYRAVSDSFRAILARGEGVLAETLELKRLKAAEVENQMLLMESSIRSLDRLTSMFQKGRLSRRKLVKAKVLLSEAQAFFRRQQYVPAGEKLRESYECVATVKEAIWPMLDRYTDRDQIARWRKWTAETIALSRESGGYAIVVSKIDRTLILYKGGVPYRTYGVGLGRNGPSDKLRAGDGATPEGKYRIIRKLPHSRYYKALLINYPDDEDRRRFAALKRRGIIPAKAGIGGLVEIHGGGKDSLTYGCISLENAQMQELYDMVEAGTPLTIVGTIEFDNTVVELMRGL